MMNMLAALHNVPGKQINFTQAFPQAKLKEDIQFNSTSFILIALSLN
jgi:hypothetical protein